MPRQSCYSRKGAADRPRARPISEGTAHHIAWSYHFTEDTVGDTEPDFTCETFFDQRLTTEGILSGNRVIRFTDHMTMNMVNPYGVGFHPDLKFFHNNFHPWLIVRLYS